MSAAIETLEPLPAVTFEARALAHRYAPGRGLAPVSFSMASPGSVAVVGPNGSGKSTLLRILAGLLRPTKGETLLKLGGALIRPSERRWWVGYAAPDLTFYPEFTVAENLGFAAEARGLGEITEAVDGALDEVGLLGRARDRVAALSSGMMQRLRIAFALLHRPAVLLLDEPGSHLDDEGRAFMARMVEGRQRVGLVVMATNDEREWSLAEQRIELTQRGLGDPA